MPKQITLDHICAEGGLYVGHGTELHEKRYDVLPDAAMSEAAKGANVADLGLMLNFFPRDGASYVSVRFDNPSLLGAISIRDTRSGKIDVYNPIEANGIEVSYGKIVILQPKGTADKRLFVGAHPMYNFQ